MLDMSLLMHHTKNTSELLSLEYRLKTTESYSNDTHHKEMHDHNLLSVLYFQDILPKYTGVPTDDEIKPKEKPWQRVFDE